MVHVELAYGSLEPRVEEPRKSGAFRRVALVFSAILGCAGVIALLSQSSRTSTLGVIDKHSCPQWPLFCLRMKKIDPVTKKVSFPCKEKYFKENNKLKNKGQLCAQFAKDCSEYCEQCECNKPDGKYCATLEASCKNDNGLIVEMHQTKEHPFVCPFGWEQVSDFGAGIEGCGLDEDNTEDRTEVGKADPLDGANRLTAHRVGECWKRHTVSTPARCAKLCEKADGKSGTKKCLAFSFNFDNRLGLPVCSRFATDKATIPPTTASRWRHRVLCKKMAKAPTPVLNEECKFEVVGHSFLQHNKIYPACPKDAISFGMDIGGFCCTGKCVHGYEGKDVPGTPDGTKITDKICAIEGNPTRMYDGVLRPKCANYQRTKFCMWAHGAKEALDTSYMKDYVVKGHVSFSGDEAGILFRMGSSTSADATRYWLKLQGGETGRNYVGLSYLKDKKAEVYTGKPGTGPVSVTYHSGFLDSKKNKVTDKTIVKLVDAAVAAKDREAKGYCTVHGVDLGGYSNRKMCRGLKWGAKDNVAYKLEATFVASEEGTWEFKMNTDFGAGGMILFDGDKGVTGWRAGGKWWNTALKIPRKLTLSQKLSEGQHKLTIYGVEPCCDGNSAIKFKAPGQRHWKPLNQKKLQEVQKGLPSRVHENHIYDFKLEVKGDRFTLDLDNQRYGTWRDSISKKLSDAHPKNYRDARKCKIIGADIKHCENLCSSYDACNGFWYSKGGAYTKTANAAISGHNTKQMKGTVAQCEKECTKLSWCKSFDYYKKDKKCDLSNKSATGFDPDVKLKKNYGGNPYDHYSANRAKCCLKSHWKQSDIKNWHKKAGGEAGAFYSYNTPRIAAGGIGLQTWKAKMDVHNLQFLTLKGKPMAEAEYEGYVATQTGARLYVDSKYIAKVAGHKPKLLELSPSAKVMALKMDPLPKYAGAMVYCDFTVDNKLISIKYGGKTLKLTKGKASDWRSTKGIRFVDLGPGHYLDVVGEEYSNCEGCKCSGFAMRCSSVSKNKWNGFTTANNVKYWRAETGAVTKNGRSCGARSVSAPSKLPTRRPCRTSSGFHIDRGQHPLLKRRYSGTPSGQKIWASGDKYWTASRKGGKCKRSRRYSNKFARIIGSPYGLDTKAAKYSQGFALALMNPMQGSMVTTAKTAKEWKCTHSSKDPPRDKNGYRWYSEKYDHKAWKTAVELKATTYKTERMDKKLEDIAHRRIVKNDKLVWAGPTPFAPPGKKDKVTCKLTIDNYLTDVQYNGEVLSISGNKNNWGAVKTITFNDAGHTAFLEIDGYEASSCNGCACSGLGLKCTSSNTKSPWHNFVSNTKNWVAWGSSSQKHFKKANNFGTPCTSTSGFYLPKESGYTKIWAKNGRKWAAFIGSPYLRQHSYCVTKFPPRKFACLEGKQGDCHTFFKGTTDKLYTDFNKDTYKPWGQKEAAKFCMAKKQNKDESQRLVFAVGRCVSGKLPKK